MTVRNIWSEMEQISCKLTKCVLQVTGTCSNADCTAGLWRPERAAGAALEEKPGTPAGNDSSPGKAVPPGA